MIKKTIRHIGFLFAFLFIASSLFSQLDVVVGTQGFSSGTDPSPYTNRYRYYRIQFVYTAAEINSALTAAGLGTGTARDIQAISWDIISNHALMDLTNYEIKMGHTTASDVATYNTDASSTVKAEHTFSPTGTGWQQIDFDSNFGWDGTSNIVFDICWSCSYYSVGASVWLYNNVADQMIAKESDWVEQCGYELTNTYNGKPRVRFTFECDPITVSVGSDIDICNTTTVAALNGNNPAGGHTGEWTLQSGTGTFTDDSDYDTEVTSVGQGENIYRWTVTNTSTGCSDYADLTVSNNTPSTPDAGTDSYTCDGTFSLDGNIPTYGNGVWSVTSGTGVFDDNSLYNTNVSNMTGSDAGTDNTYTWTITNNGCSLSDDVDITYYLPPVASVTTSPLTGCYATDVLTLNGNDPDALTPVATGEWTVIDGAGTFTDDTDHETTVTNVGTPTNTYRWTLTRNGCISSANVVVNNSSPSLATAGSNQTISSTSTTLQGNTPDQGTGTWTVSPTGPTFSPNANTPNATVSNISENTLYTFTWTISNGACDDTSDDVTILNIPNILGFVIQEDLTNDGSFIQTDENNYFIMNGSNNDILGGTSSNNTYTDAKLRVIGTITFDGEIDNGKFEKTEVAAVGDFTINSSRTYKNHDLYIYGDMGMLASSIIENSGDWENTNNYTANTSSIVKFNGDALQEVTTNCGGASNFFPNVQINQTVVTPSTSNGVDAQDPFWIMADCTLQLNNGVLICEDGTGGVIIENDASNAVTGNYSQSWVYAPSSSHVFQRFLDDVNNEDYDFPLGATDVPNIAIMNNRNLPDGTFYINSYFTPSPSNVNTNFPSDLYEDDLLYNSVSEYGIWGFNPNGSYDGYYDLDLNIENFGIDAAYDNLYGMLKRPSGDTDGANWHVPTGSSVITQAVSSNYAVREDISTFSEYGIGLASSTLPVELIYFESDCFAKYIMLDWATQTEINNDYFIIEKSIDGRNFFEIAKISGNGNSNQLIEYSYKDYDLASKHAYYRLIQVDYDGTATKYKTIFNNCETHQTENTFEVYPNPFRTNINISSSNVCTVVLNLYDSKGSIIKNEKLTIENMFTYDLSKLMPGLYYLQLIDNNKTHTFLIEKQ